MTLKMFVIDYDGERFWYAAESEDDAIMEHESLYDWDEEISIDKVTEVPPDTVCIVGGDIEAKDVPEGGSWDEEHQRATATAAQWLTGFSLPPGVRAVSLWSTIF